MYATSRRVVAPRAYWSPYGYRHRQFNDHFSVVSRPENNHIARVTYFKRDVNCCQISFMGMISYVRKDDVVMNVINPFTQKKTRPRVSVMHGRRPAK